MSSGQVFNRHIDFIKSTTYDMKSLIYVISISAVLFALGYFLSSFYFLGISCLLVTGYLLYIIGELFYDKRSDEDAVVCLCAFLFIIFSVSNFLWHGPRYISDLSRKQHLYNDCSVIKNSSVRKVTETQGFFFLTFADCTTCELRKKDEKLNKRKTELRKDIKCEINRLENLLKDLDNGEDVSDIEDKFYPSEEDEQSSEYYFY
jgi:hypothetical protein